MLGDPGLQGQRVWRRTRKVYAVDLFCGAGGLSHGLEKAGIDVRLGVDVDPACKYPYTANNKARFMLKPIEALTPQEIESVLRKNGIRLLAGCAPCQTFSTYYQKATPEDERWWLLLTFMSFVQTIRPHLVTMENVPGLIERDVFQVFVQSMEGMGYHVRHAIVNCVDYGVPQHRQRLVLLASLLGPISVLSPAEFGASRTTVRDSIAHMPLLNAGGVDQDDPLHQAASLSTVNLRRMKASNPGGTWRDWDRELLSPCHKRSKGKTYPSVYGRMCWDGPSPTITTQFFGFGNGRFGHPEQDRAISLREGAILQSFPKDYKFVSPGQIVSKKAVGRLIGNAVPPMLGEVIGRSIQDHVNAWVRSRKQ